MPERHTDVIIRTTAGDIRTSLTASAIAELAARLDSSITRITVTDVDGMQVHIVRHHVVAVVVAPHATAL